MDALQYYPWLYIGLASLFGLLVGSFLNVVIYRLPKIMELEWRQECAESFPEYKISPPTETLTLSMPRSSCPSCHTPIRVRDNIPVFSWLALRGKCHHCQTKISARYPFVEALSAFLCGLIAWKFGYAPITVALIGFTLVLIAATFIDLDTMLLPDQLTLPLTWAGIALALLEISPVSLQDSVIGAMAGYLCLWSVYHLFRLLTGKEGMGYGDFKLLAALGAWLGWQYLPMIILLSSVVGLIFGLIQLRLQKQGIEMAFPFGPYLAIAGWVALMWGDSLMSWYLNYLIGA
ncbi:prepilin peptidase [Vibrio vulnificus]|uniref:prepilin peptidase n=1 Tax=Vibrio vulnificus TaxID=672 RepID=UPI0005F230F4|nr:A24 family peptidase [Vibrio vulnificus]EGR0127301.1 prepilin peptidase [Vibrio vulnificus]EHD1697416.1 prepilin peptidase [Vibrio vulnificus]EHU4977687.1 prepilin peptidase [Vibrio vulnificus]EJC6735767.1 prepilin peptidase [Vibrio vulnificus]EKZ9179913.1 prepilin peptidase [Vibrio vulnificus]